MSPQDKVIATSAIRASPPPIFTTYNAEISCAEISEDIKVLAMFWSWILNAFCRNMP